MVYCGQFGNILYPVSETATDPVYDVLDAQDEDEVKFWIARRVGGTCTCLNRRLSGYMLEGYLVEELRCEETLPFFCKDCSHGGDGCSEAFARDGGSG